ncbi:MAG TPA: ATP-binding cassette domain-containing protein [Gemmatales bacterium]|nr:ATP-binding cassette domain-containing protein [Gemmatales bacterium]
MSVVTPEAENATRRTRPPLLEVENLSVELGGKSILKQLSARIPRGEISALIGLNGSGKTTFLKALLKEVAYTGKVQWRCGHDHSQPFPHLIGYVPQRLQFDTNQPLTVVELLALSLLKRPLFLGIGKSLRMRIVELLKRVHAEKLLDVPVGGLSGGQLQRGKCTSLAKPTRNCSVFFWHFPWNLYLSFCCSMNQLRG